jgi:uncharacterized membrane protein (UPF0127 family)
VSNQVLALALLLTLAASGVSAQDAECARWRAAFAGMPVRNLSIDSGTGLLPLRIRLADSPEQQAAGFQCATPQEIRQHLILFDFRREILTQFHMQNVPAPLDIAFAKADGRIFAILQMAPSPTALYGPLGPFRYALEARAGFFASHGIRPGGARLVLDP